MKSSRIPAGRSVLIVLGTLLPLAWLIWAVFTFKITAPFREQWYFMYVVEKSWLGTLEFRDLWQQEAEHRHPFPYLIMLALAHLSRWNIAWELGANIVIACGTFLALAVQAARVTGRKLNWFLPLLSVIVFSLSQYETWTWGFHLVTYLNLFAVVTGMLLLAHPAGSAVRYVLALVLGVVACFSFASGFMYWVSGGLIVWFQSAPAVRRRRIAGWLLMACVTAALFFYGYQLPSWSAPSEVVLKTPARFVEFLLVSLGTPLVPLRRISALAVGVVGLALLVVVSWRLIRREQASPAELSFYWGLAVYAVGTAALISLGRANFGEALSGRYTTTTSLLWIAIVMLLYHAGWPRQGQPGAHFPVRMTCRTLLFILAAAFTWRTVQGVKAFQWYYDRFKPAQDELYVLTNPERALPLFPPNPPIEEMVGKLRTYRWGIFRGDGASD